MTAGIYPVRTTLIPIMTASCVLQFMKQIITNEEIEAFWEFCEIIWPGVDPEIVCPVIICPHCGETDPYFLSTRLAFKCRSCLGQFSPTTGNEFRCTKVPYTKLVRMVRLLWAGKNAHQIHVLAGVNYRTASLFWNRFMNAAYIRSDRRSLVSKGSRGKRQVRRRKIHS